MICIKIFIMGGTFDPVHSAHMFMARKTLEAFKGGRVMFIPSLSPPHKATPGATVAQRLKMLEISIGTASSMEISTVEIARGGVSYAVDTLKALKEQHPDDEFIYIIGYDMLMTLSSWRDFESLSKMCGFFVFPRGNSDMDAARAEAKSLFTRFQANILFSPSAPPEISSTAVRDLISAGRSITGLVDSGVEEYINQNRLYGMPMGRNDIVRDLEKKLSGERFLHSMGVEKIAGELAQLYGGDEKKARLAGLIHDRGKAENINKDNIISLCQKYGVDTSGYEDSPMLLHAPLGAALVKEDYAVDDGEILSAISRHTICAPDMTVLEKALYVADAIEPSRNYPGVNELRRLSRENLDEAFIQVQRQKLVSTLNKGKPLNIEGVKAYNQYLLEKK